MNRNRTPWRPASLVLLAVLAAPAAALAQPAPVVLRPQSVAPCPGAWIGCCW